MDTAVAAGRTTRPHELSRASCFLRSLDVANRVDLACLPSPAGVTQPLQTPDPPAPPPNHRLGHREYIAGRRIPSLINYGINNDDVCYSSSYHGDCKKRGENF